MTKHLKFSMQYRPTFQTAITARTHLATTRLFDDKALATGDEVELLLASTGKLVRRAHIERIELSDFRTVLAAARDPEGTRHMYHNYYQRDIPLTTPVKEITLRLIDQESLADTAP